MHLAKMQLNEQVYNSASSELIFFPGRSLNLLVMPEGEVLDQKSVVAIIKKVLPGGESLKSQLCAKLPVGEFELGPFTAPPVYVFLH